MAIAKSSVLIQSDLMARSAAGPLATWPENTSADASGIGNATEHAIAKWQAFRWRKSKDCQHVIQVVLSLRANANHQSLKLEEILTRHLPRLFIPNTEDAFFTMLCVPTSQCSEWTVTYLLTDANLRDSVVDVFAEWRHQHLLTYQKLLENSAVARQMNVCLPKEVPMWQWIKRRLHGEIYMTEVETDQWAIHVVQPSLFSKQIVERCRVANGYRTLSQPPFNVIEVRTRNTFFGPTPASSSAS